MFPGWRAYGGGAAVVASTLVELVFSFVLAPIMAVAQTIFVLGMTAGRTIRWEAQLRDTRNLPWGEALHGLWPQTLFGFALGAALAAGARRRPPVGRAVLRALVLAVPFAVVTSWVPLGRALARLGICAVPEEIDPPAVVLAVESEIERIGWRLQRVPRRVITACPCRARTRRPRRCGPPAPACSRDGRGAR